MAKIRSLEQIRAEHALGFVSSIQKKQGKIFFSNV